MSNILKKLANFSESEFKDDSLLVNRSLLEIEIYLDGLRVQKLSRKVRLGLNKFESRFKELKIYLFLSRDLELFKEQALKWADILQIRSSLI